MDARAWLELAQLCIGLLLVLAVKPIWETRRDVRDVADRLSYLEGWIYGPWRRPAGSKNPISLPRDGG